MQYQMPETTRSFPDWNLLYKNEKGADMPWYNEKLDQDLDEAIIQRRMVGGNDIKFLDIGTGPGTQAIRLSELGFNVTGSDLSEYAIEKARKLSDKVNFRVDDILDSKLKENEFEYIFDRGCFHVLSVDDRNRYVSKVKNILKKNGILFLKCFSDKEMREEGPHRFSQDKIKVIFGKDFEILSIKETVYQGTLDPLPKALFVVMRKKENQ
jgi:SAM-dependent methyltransferase